MKKANLIKITNGTNYNVVLWPKKRSYQDKIAIFIGSNSTKMLDLMPSDVTLDLDTYYFQFQNDKKKIKIDEVNQYGIKVEYHLYDRRKST